MEYGPEAIQVLEGLEPVRKRPAMFIGSTDARGMHQLAFEAIDNSVDEAVAGFCTRIVVEILPGNRICVEDNGRGIPPEPHPKYGISTLQLVLTTLHSGGKFDGKVYRVSGGLHGVGISAANALSKELCVEVKRGGKIWRQEYALGVPKGPVQPVGSCAENETGTKISLIPSPEIFGNSEWDFEILSERLRELAYLNKGLLLELKDHRTGAEASYCYQGGLVEFLEYLRRGKPLGKPFYALGQKNGIVIEAALLYTDSYSESLLSFANNIRTKEGGSHLAGLKAALTKAMQACAAKVGIPKGLSLEPEDFREGLIGIVSVKVPNPQFEGQTKTKLGNSDVKGAVESFVGAAFSEWLSSNQQIAKAIVAKALTAARAREAAKKAKEVIRKAGLACLPGKLAGCRLKGERAELFIVEGDSAGGSAKQARNKEFQAILPLKGKIINVEKARLVKVLKNSEIAALISAIGTGIKEDFDLSKLKFGKIIIMTDADVDGSHITCLLLTFFFRNMPELIRAGRIYLAQPPLYRIVKGKKVIYARTEEEKARLCDGGQVQRFKGLGEMNPEQLWETTMSPATRQLKQIGIEDCAAADAAFSMLMGEAVEPRKEFILKHCREVQQLDV